jgi:hypothetical protein
MHGKTGMLRNLLMILWPQNTKPFNLKRPNHIHHWSFNSNQSFFEKRRLHGAKSFHCSITFNPKIL